ncbi:MAG: hypothetical protein ACRELC_03165 [Gemmatimonadota bacterium]
MKGAMMAKAKHRLNGNGHAMAATLLAPNLRTGARPGRSRPERATDEDELTPAERFQAVYSLQATCREIQERVAIERGPLESMRFGNWTRSTLDSATQERQSAKVEALRDELADRGRSLAYALDMFREDPGDERYWLGEISANRTELQTARKALQGLGEKLRIAQRAAHEDASVATLRAMTVLQQLFQRHEGEERERADKARVLSAGRQLAATYRQNLVDEDCRICCSPSVAAVNRDWSPTTAQHYGFTSREFEQHAPHVRQFMLRSRTVGMELVDVEGRRVDLRQNGRRG